MNNILSKTNTPFEGFSAGRICADLRNEIKFEGRILAIGSAILCAAMCICATAMLLPRQELTAQRTTQTSSILAMQ